FEVNSTRVTSADAGRGSAIRLSRQKRDIARSPFERRGIDVLPDFLFLALNWPWLLCAASRAHHDDGRLTHSRKNNIATRHFGRFVHRFVIDREAHRVTRDI